MSNFPIRRLILLPTLGVLIFIFIIFVFSTYWLNSHIVHNLLSLEIQNIVSTLHQKMTEQAVFFKSQMVILSKSTSLREHFLSGDREALLRESNQIMETLRENHITHFYFHLPDRTNFLRVHNPNKYGDHSNRNTLLQSEKSGTFSFGAEIGKIGTLTLRGVLPWFDGERLIGYLELGKEIEHFINEMQPTLRVQLYTFFHKNFFDKTAFQNASLIFGSILDWESFPELLFIGKKGTVYPKILLEYMKDNKWKIDDPLLSLSDKDDFILFSIPIRDTENRIVCRVIGISEFSSYKEIILSNNYVLGGTAIGLILFFGLFFYRNVTWVQDKLNVMTVSRDKMIIEMKEREKVERMLHQERDFSNLILLSTGDGIYGVDKAKHCIFINRAGLELLGYDNEDAIIGEKIHSLIHHTRADGSPFPESECVVHGMRMRKDIIRIENEIFWRRDGTFFPVEYASFPINVNEEIIGSVVVFHDITQRKHYQEKELYLSFQSGVAEMSVTLLHNIGNAIMSISHRSELLEKKSNYLVEMGQVIINMGEFVRRQIDHGQTEKQILTNLVIALEETGREFLDIAKKDFLETANKIKKGVEHIADIVRIHNSSAHHVIEKKEFNLLQLIEDAIIIQEDVLTKYAIKTNASILNSLGIVFLPRAQMSQLMINLIKNAFEAIVEQKKFGKIDGIINITAVKFGIDNTLKISIEDNGCGIPEENLKSIFNYGMTTKQEGTGFGLHSTANFVKSLGGHIEAQSSGRGCGATFLIQIPEAFKRL